MHAYDFMTCRHRDRCEAETQHAGLDCTAAERRSVCLNPGTKPRKVLHTAAPELMSALLKALLYAFANAKRGSTSVSCRKRPPSRSDHKTSSTREQAQCRPQRCGSLADRQQLQWWITGLAVCRQQPSMAAAVSAAYQLGSMVLQARPFPLVRVMPGARARGSAPSRWCAQARRPPPRRLTPSASGSSARARCRAPRRSW